ncbi:MAG: hypothetical protein R3B90_02695 [Planctomycetaceae bacterium]
MPRIEFTPQLAKHVDCPARDSDAASLRTALDEAFAASPKLRGYILDDQSRLRQHVAIFVDNQLLRDRDNWNVPLRPESLVFVMQALSGG